MSTRATPAPAPAHAAMPAIAQAIVETILTRLATLFLIGANGDAAAARDAARQMLASYDIQTEEELYLVAEIISFGFHALEALGQAAAPDLSLNKKLRLRGSAVSLSREGHKAQRRLDRLQRARRMPETVAKPKSAAKAAPLSQATQPNTQPAMVQKPASAAAAPHIQLPPLPAPTRPAIPVICLEDPNKDTSFAARMMQDIAAEAARQKHPPATLNSPR